ncbi:MAG: DUF2336 domain-containing protein, partial [Sphingomonadales bacterium]
MVLTDKLTQADVRKLLADPSADNRVNAARKIGSQFAETDLGPREKTLIEEIFRVMVRDVEVRVRAALSDSLKDNPDIPREIAISLASDVSEVALPIIEFSEVLKDEDLMEIIATRGEDHQQAVARRDRVSETVSDALVDTGNETVISTLVSNAGAALSEATMTTVVENYGHNPGINEPLALRTELPLTVAEKLVSLVSDRIRDHLVTHHAMSADVATDLFLSAREKATVGLLQPETNLRDVVDLIDQLHDNGRLTPTLILRALCMGDTTFFEAALARRADVPIANAYRLIHDKGGRGLEALFKKSRLSSQMLEVCR